jgi:chromosome segregation ATPase
MDILDDVNKYKRLCDTYSSKINSISKGDNNKNVDELNMKVENLTRNKEELSNKIDQLNKKLESNKEKLDLMDKISQQVNEQQKDTDGYKKITNERIEKLVKLFLIVNNNK